jgi:hypothetical protein
MSWIYRSSLHSAFLVGLPRISQIDVGAVLALVPGTSSLDDERSADRVNEVSLVGLDRNTIKIAKTQNNL